MQTMLHTETKVRLSDRAIGSIQSAILLFGFAVFLSLFMAAVIFLNGAAK